MLVYRRLAPEKRWLEDDPFLLGFGNFSGATFVKLLEGMNPASLIAFVPADFCPMHICPPGNKHIT